LSLIKKSGATVGKVFAHPTTDSDYHTFWGHKKSAFPLFERAAPIIRYNQKKSMTMPSIVSASR
jgi:hypothetical protein